MAPGARWPLPYNGSAAQLRQYAGMDARQPQVPQALLVPVDLEAQPAHFERQGE